ncbi:AbrB/MazE/SpoVT family DNA-binding domain-containing protein [bacterium]|nr:AbrB/MazE/SpoVT family DNA-binding domain-containing protein [bacterium]
MTHLKIRRIGNSLGVVLPADALSRHRIGQGDTLILSETPDGFRLDVYDAAVSEQVEAGRKLARRYRNTLRELAK